MTIGVVILTGIALLGSATALSADQVPQGMPEQDQYVSSLRAPDLVPAPTVEGDETEANNRGSGDRDQNQEPPDTFAARRACDGCPPRSVGKALFQTTIVNVFYEAANLIRGQDTAKITPEDVVGQHGAGVGLGSRRLRRQPDRPPVPGQQLLQYRARERPELLRVGSRDGLWQRHVGVFRRDEPRVAERLHQHHARRHRARRDVPPYGLAGARHACHRSRTDVERDRWHRARSHHGREPLHHRRCLSPDRQTCATWCRRA